MGTEKPKKRLVGWAEYCDAVSTRGATSLVAGALGFGGSLLLSVAGSAVILMLVQLWQRDISGAMFCAVVGAITGLFGAIGTWLARFFFAEARKITPVALLTKASARDLPEVEVLVRGSDLPPPAQQAELLRAAGKGAETPPEQLLRATQKSGQDV
jgi:hypothetical protein